jgi:hypothetical protein
MRAKALLYKARRRSKSHQAFAKLARVFAEIATLQLQQFGWELRDCTARADLRRGEMADHGEIEYATATGNDYDAHEETYRNFIRLVKVSMTVVVVILILMAYFLT